MLSITPFCKKKKLFYASGGSNYPCTATSVLRLVRQAAGVIQLVSGDGWKYSFGEVEGRGGVGEGGRGCDVIKINPIDVPNLTPLLYPTRIAPTTTGGNNEVVVLGQGVLEGGD